MPYPQYGLLLARLLESRSTALPPAAKSQSHCLGTRWAKLTAALNNPSSLAVIVPTCLRAWVIRRLVPCVLTSARPQCPVTLAVRSKAIRLITDSTTLLWYLPPVTVPETPPRHMPPISLPLEEPGISQPGSFLSPAVDTLWEAPCFSEEICPAFTSEPDNKGPVSAKILST